MHLSNRVASCLVPWLRPQFVHRCSCADQNGFHFALSSHNCPNSLLKEGDIFADNLHDFVTCLLLPPFTRTLPKMEEKINTLEPEKLNEYRVLLQRNHDLQVRLLVWKTTHRTSHGTRSRRPPMEYWSQKICCRGKTTSKSAPTPSLDRLPIGQPFLCREWKIGYSKQHFPRDPAQLTIQQRRCF